MGEESAALASSVLDDVLREVKAIREKIEKVEEIVEERLIGVEEPSVDEKKAIGDYLKIKEKAEVQLVPLEDVEKEQG
ncbi:hypothetical protein MUP00_08645 [Candidatus Bathyarchaeota archaeon]|nr:hypothetical protein [Candidatus Bathyarchaeota archaeon]